MEPIVLAYKTTNMTMTESKAYDKAFSILCAGAAETQAGTVRWKCFEKPATDITVVLMEI